MAGVLVLNYVLWKRRGRGWRRHVDAFIAVLQPYVDEPVTAATRACTTPRARKSSASHAVAARVAG